MASLLEGDRTYTDMRTDYEEQSENWFDSAMDAANAGDWDVFRDYLGRLEELAKEFDRVIEHDDPRRLEIGEGVGEGLPKQEEYDEAFGAAQAALNDAETALDEAKTEEEIEAALRAIEAAENDVWKIFDDAGNGVYGPPNEEAQSELDKIKEIAGAVQTAEAAVPDLERATDLLFDHALGVGYEPGSQNPPPVGSGKGGPADGRKASMPTVPGQRPRIDPNPHPGAKVPNIPRAKGY